MLGYVYIAVLFALVSKCRSKGVSDETQQVLVKIVDGQTKNMGDYIVNASKQLNNEELNTLQKKKTTGVKFRCSVSEEVRLPLSVHELRPEDIDVICAIGDSYTAAYGAGATFLGRSAFLEYRGLSFSIGGDETIETHITIPNVLKKFNPDVYGFSVGIGEDVDRSKLNVAETGATSDDILGQVDVLIKRLQEDPLVNMEEDWKLITVFIGGNDIFDACLHRHFTPAYFKKQITKAFNILKEKVPRALVNVLPPPDIVEITKLKGAVCNTVQMSMCPCLFGGKLARKKLAALSREYTNILQDITSSGEFDTDDFTLVYQPYSNTVYVPVGKDGTADSSLFAPDCLHLSRLGQGTAAFYLWSNMLEPVNSKVTKWTPTIDEYLPCPLSPYLFTNRNSGTSGVSSNQHLPATDSGTKSIGGGAVTAIVFIVVAVVIISSYILFKKIKTNRLQSSYTNL